MKEEWREDGKNRGRWKNIGRLNRREGGREGGGEGGGSIREGVIAREGGMEE